MSSLSITSLKTVLRKYLAVVNKRHKGTGFKNYVFQ